MLELKFIVENPELVKKAMKDKGEKRADVGLICQLYTQRKEILKKVETLRARLNLASREMARLKREGKDDPQLVAMGRELGDQIKQYEDELAGLDERLQAQLIWVPNIAAGDVPVGTTGSSTQVRSWGTRRHFTFKPKPHWELGEQLGIIDFKRVPKLSGSNFVLLKGMGARLERALIQFMLDLHTKRHGYIEVFPPYLSTREAMFSTGQLPKLEQDMYLLRHDELFLIPTAEVPVTNLHKGEILNWGDLPLYYVSYTACFRREAGAYGRETRGLIRVHQFDKVELVKFTHPDSSFDELESLLRDAETVLQLLGLEYRVVLLSTGELSFASAKTYDIEVWAPGIERWLEVSSCGNFTDFQARRMQTRFRDKDGRLKYVHTLNGSGIALPRTLIALLENYQQADGSVLIPEALQPYMDGVKRLEARP